MAAAETGGRDINFDGLPEGCVANALSLTSPEDACRLSLTGSTFRSAAMSDAVWERFLPPDYRDIISRSADAADLLASAASKKDLYFRLCDFPVLIDGDTKSFSLEKKSGKKCYMIGSRSLKIVWSDTPKYWRWISLPHSRFLEAAELISVCWLEICGSIDTTTLSPNTNYAAYLVFTLQPKPYGFEYQPLDAEMTTADNRGGAKKQTVYLDPRGAERDDGGNVSGVHAPPMAFRPRSGTRVTYRARRQAMNADLERGAAGRFPRRRSCDGWMEVELGEFFVGEGGGGEVGVRLTEINSQWKSGLVVEGIEIRPKEEEDKHM
ncbi:unnamed protein product [Cuscuta campestris]|uniref:F-box domain-containing protein n=1 Tax=Cuscuta campestris TaxID=132261 RepID=A0A484MXB0_9ASTE|nr:unnamed protein product [Cuscuta campestris]